MIDQERVREMTKLAAFEQHEGKQYRKAACCYCSDFIGIHLLKGFISGTAAFAICFGLWGICHMEELIADLGSMDLIAFGTSVLVRYIFFLIIFRREVVVWWERMPGNWGIVVSIVRSFMWLILTFFFPV